MASVAPHTKLEVPNLHQYKPVIHGSRVLLIDGVQHFEGDHSTATGATVHAISSANAMFPGTFALSEKGNVNAFIPIKASGSLPEGAHVSMVYGADGFHVFAPKQMEKQHLDRVLQAVVPRLDNVHRTLSLAQAPQPPPAGLMPLQEPIVELPSEPQAEIDERFRDLRVAPRAVPAGGFPVC